MSEQGEMLSRLAEVDLAGLSRRARIDALVALERVKGWVEAQQQCILAALASEQPAPDGTDPLGDELGKQWVREEVACALRIGAPTAAARLAAAVELTTRFPQTLKLLGAGQLSLPMARRLVESTVGLDDAAAAVVQHRVLARAPGQTFSQFAQAVRRAVIAADPRSADEQHTGAAAERCVRVRPLEHGMAELWTINTADAISAAWTALTQAATKEPSTGHEDGARLVDQRRADALVDLLTGAAASRPGRVPAVQVTVAASTLLGLDDQPGELAGYGPIPPALARAIAADPTGTWRRLVTDEQGRLRDYGRTTYRPPVALADHVRARDGTCRFPTCNRRAHHCELDHVLARNDDGTTSAANLHALCTRHHHAKHEAGWTVTRHGDTRTEWTSPSGHRYVKPADTLPVDTTMTIGKGNVGRESRIDHDTGPPPI